MSLVVANNSMQAKAFPTNFSFENGSKPILSNVAKKAFVIPKITTQNDIVKFSLSDFNYKFNLILIDIEWKIYSPIIQLKLKLADDVFVKLILKGNWEKQEKKQEPKFNLGDVGVELENKSEKPTSNFVAVTFWAMLALSKKCEISIPSLNDYNFDLSFDVPINRISNLLQERQLAYRLMVIEKALDIQLPFPHSYIDGKDVENIAYSYHSIIDGDFDWFCSPNVIPVYANEAYLAPLPSKNIPFPIQLKPEPVVKNIFGYEINLGLQTAKIKDYIIDNFDEVITALSKLDESQVLAKTRSKSGVMQIESLTTPELPKNAFSKDIQKLIDFDEKLDSMVMDKYLNSFSNAFEGLTDEQIEAITERPILEEEAFNF